MGLNDAALHRRESHSAARVVRVLIQVLSKHTQVVEVRRSQEFSKVACAIS
jgi:hypothetical protein